jgi:type IV pilus assembly protein PilC
MKFKYQAKTKEGVTQVGFVEASDRDAASAILSGHDLFVLSVIAEHPPTALDNIAGFFGRATRKDLIIFTRQLATLLEARLPLNNALKILYEQTTNARLKDAISQVTEDIDAGVSFSQAMARQEKIFPDYYIEMIRAAEVTGNLNEVAAFLADYTEKEGDLASKAASALVYPGIVVALFIVVAFILLTFVRQCFRREWRCPPVVYASTLEHGNVPKPVVDRRGGGGRCTRHACRQLFSDRRGNCVAR